MTSDRHIRATPYESYPRQEELPMQEQGLPYLYAAAVLFQIVLLFVVIRLTSGKCVLLFVVIRLTSGN